MEAVYLAMHVPMHLHDLVLTLKACCIRRPLCCCAFVLAEMGLSLPVRSGSMLTRRFRSWTAGVMTILF